MVRLVGVGELESSTYVTPVEQAPVLPAASMAAAEIVVVVSSATLTVRPGVPNAAAEPVASAVPEQSDVG